MRLTGEGLTLSARGRRTNLWRVLVLLALIGGGIWLTRLVEAGQVEPLFLPTPTSTRPAASFYDEAQVHFSAGDLGKAIEAYQAAAALRPDDPRLWAELARVQTYFSSLQPNQERRLARLAEARQSIERAVEINPDDPFAQAVRALVYDWSASAYAGDDRVLFDEYLRTAADAAVTAERLEPNNVLAQAYKAEVLLDQQNWAQAVDLDERAVAQAESDPTFPSAYKVDVHRVYAQVLETGGAYNAAIQEYRKAVAINPNLTFLYLKIGANYRRLRDVDNALEAFDTAVRINEQNNVQDPIPYLAIGRTYLQEGEFFVAARNVERAVIVDPGNAELWGFLGIVYYKARNYESAMDVLACAVEGCSSLQTGELFCERLEILFCNDPEQASIADYGTDVIGVSLGAGTVEYYYTYASALAFQKRCADAEPYFQQLLAAYGDDPIVVGIVEENRSICAGDLLPPAPATPADSMPETNS